MKNTLNPCKCGSSEGGAEFSSQITYNGLDVSCIPGLVGQNLSQVIKSLGDFACGISGGTQLLTVNVGEPTGGSEGDIWIRQQGNAITFYQNVSGAWLTRGQIFVDDSYTPDQNLPDPPTKTYLNTNYPSAKVGDVVYWEGTTQVVEAKCYAAGEWNYSTKNRCQ